MIEILLICSLMIGAPGYDCDEQWLIFWYTDSPFIVPDRSPYGLYASGWAVYNATKWSVCDWKDDIDPRYCGMKWIAIDNSVGDECYDYNCYTPLHHEIKHLQCECNWHKNMTGTRNQDVWK